MKLLIVGDFCDCGRVGELIYSGDYSALFGGVKSIIDGADVSVVNFEFPVVLDSSRTNPIQKCGPSLKGQKKAVDAIKYAGFNVCTLANNHILDQGKNCCLDTKYTIEENGIKTVGVGDNLSEASETIFIRQGEETLAIINCCEHEYSIATETTAGANPLNPIQQYYKIQEARDVANYVLVIVHGGHEHYNLPSPRMQELYRFFIDSGADAVVNHHQHCYSGYEIYKEKPIFYGVGNFCFDRLNDGLPTSWHEGYMVELSFGGNDGVKFRLIPYNQCKKEATVVLMKDKERDAFFESIRQLNTVISDTSELKRKHEEWMDSNGSGFEHQFLPYSNRWLISAYIRHLFPSFLSKRKLLKLQNHLECESHNERSLYALNKLINK